MVLPTCKNKIWLSIFLFLYAFSHVCLANTVEMQLSTHQMTFGDSLIVTFILNNHGSRDFPDFSALKKDFRILNTNYGYTANTINGITSMQTFWRLELQPTHAGELIIPEIIFGGIKSTVNKIKVIKNNSQPNNPIDLKQNSPVFLRSEISTHSPYIQTQVIYTFKLYFSIPLRNPRIELPTIKDIDFYPLNDIPVYQTTINGKIYNVIEKTFALFGKKSGITNIPPLKFTAFAIDENTNLFDPFSFNEPKIFSLFTNNYNFVVQDIPKNYRSATWLAAKQLSLTEEWSNKTQYFELGTPVTRVITINAQGLHADQLPDLFIDKINGVNVYLDRPKRSNHFFHDKIVGTYEQKITYIPNDTDSFTIPPLKINWWNTQRNLNEVAQLDGKTVLVKSIVGIPHGGTNLTSNLSHPLSKAKSIPTPAMRSISYGFYKSSWFWIACLCLFGWILTLCYMFSKSLSKKDKTNNQIQNPVEISIKNFEQACALGQTRQAQHYLLCWARKQWPDIIINLTTLNELIHDESFNLAVQELEQVLYTKENLTWNGKLLFAAFKRIKKSGKCFNAADVNRYKMSNLQSDPLPPLNPMLIQKNTK